MSAETNPNVAEEEVVQPVEEAQHNDVSEEEQPNQQNKRNDAEYNWAEMRRQREKDKERMEALEREIQSLKKPATVEEENFGFNDDDLIEGKHLKDLKREIKQLRSELKQKEVASMDDRLQMKYPDYTQIVSVENVELLKQNEPELAKSLAYMSDPYEQAVAAYKLLKRLGINKQDSNPVERKKALENTQKPLSVNAVTKNSAIGNAHLFENGLTPELKNYLWEEMKQAKKGV